MKRKIIALLLAVALIGSVAAGCSKKEEPVSATDSSETITPEATEIPQETSAPAPESTPAQNKDSSIESHGSAPSKEPGKTPSKSPSGNHSATEKPTDGDKKEQPAAQPPAQTAAPSIALSDLMGKMIGALPADSYSLSQIPDDFIGNVYQIDKSYYEDVLVYGSMMGVHANEIILIKAKNAAGVSEAKKTLQNRKSKLLEQWKSYLPEQYELVKQSVITSEGFYVAFVCADNQKKAVNAFHAAFK